MRFLPALGIALAALVTSAVPARADTPVQADRLCSGSPERGCSITVADTTREGATYPVTVTGNPEARVRVLAYQAVVEDGELTALEPLGDGVEVITGREGVVTVDLPIPATATAPSSGWALVSVGGLEGTDTSMTVGSFVPFGARVPSVLGDGYDTDKPVGEELELEVVGAVPGTRFRVELSDGNGSWEDVTLEGGTTAEDPSEVSTIRYALPRGLTNSARQLRLVNVSDTAVSPVWEAVPATDGTPATIEEPFSPPPVGDALDGTKPLAAHPTSAVRWTAAGIGVAGLLAAIGLLAAPLLRRREAP